YTPNAGYAGSDSFTYQAKDPSNALSAVTTVTLTVNPGVNQAPVAADDSYDISENSVLMVTAVSGVLANDSDPDFDMLHAFGYVDRLMLVAPAHGSLNLNTDGSFDYTPDSGYSGTDSFTYVANDGTADSNVATVTLNVVPV